jgi:hypothetical protein
MLSLLRAKRGVSIVGLWLVTVTQATASPPHKTKPQTVDPAQATEPAVPPFRYEGPLGPALSLLRQGKPQQAKGLLAQTPAHGINDIGFARTVGTHDSGDAGVEDEFGALGEGLEALDGDALNQHRGGS